MTNGREKSDPSSCEAGEQDRTTGGGVSGAKGRGRGKHGRATHAPDSEPGKRVPGARPCTESSAVEEEGTVHRLASLCDGRSTEGRLFQPQAGSGSGCRWSDMAELQAEPGSELSWIARASASRHVSSAPIAATIYTKTGWTTTSTGHRRAGG
jgi:hypothetical protein